jgi:DNA-binding response OmpR family regulator
MKMKASMANRSPRVFIVEDETLLAMLIEIMLEELGYTTVFHASSLDDGVAYARTGDFDVAILDINIIGGNSFPIAAALTHRGIPFTFCSGYGRLGVPDAWATTQCVAKPFSAEQLDAALTHLLKPAGNCV